MQHANQLEQTIHAKQKSKKFQQLITIQKTKIKENMQQGKKSVVWIFNDKDYYHTELELTWFHEFQEKARQLFEGKGCAVSYDVIRWGQRVYF